MHVSRRLSVALLLSLSLTLSCGGGGPDDRPRIALSLHIQQAPAEVDGGDPFAAPAPRLDRVLEILNDVANEDYIRGVMLRVGPLGGAYATALDLRDAAQRIRERGKPVHCHFEVADNAAYTFMAQACDRISATPAGQLDLVGVAIQTFYLRGLLDTLGVEADLMQVGRYKGAAEPLTESQMSPALRESLQELVDGLYGQITDALRARGVASDDIDRIVDAGPYETSHAREQSLIDDVGFDDEATEHLRRAADVEFVERVPLSTPAREPSLEELLSVLGGNRPQRRSWLPRVAVVRLAGQIVDGEMATLDGGSSGPFVRYMRQLADDENVRAVVLRVDSPGGSAMASDRMWHAVRLVAQRKPVIASVGNMAASGGYYVASAATRILVQPASLVGSIGVVGGKIVLGEALREAGVTPEILQRGRNAAWATPARAFTGDERRQMQRMMRNTYRRFIRRIATSREMTPESITPGAEGRLMVGTRAMELGLVDGIGGLTHAIAEACEEANLGDDCEVEYWPRHRTPLEQLSMMLGQPGEVTLSRVANALGPLPLGQVSVAQWRQLQTLHSERLLLANPFIIRIDGR